MFLETARKRYRILLKMKPQCAWKRDEKDIEIYPKWCQIWVRLEDQRRQVYGRSKKSVETNFFMLKCRFGASAWHPQKASMKFNTTTIYLPGPARGTQQCQNGVYRVDVGKTNFVH